jgi:MPBQ/MSBQ methyltransferase
MKQKLDTRAIGLDVGLSFVKWVTGAENLHYGFWEGREVSAGNLRAAQDAYTDLLFSYLPEGPLKILDIGGGAGETAAKLIKLGHSVEIVVPSAFLAARCRENAPGAVVHETTFEGFTGKGPFDLCLFSESYQYIPLAQGLPKCAGLLKPGGHVLLADCFRSDEFAGLDHSIVGGGHRLADYRALLEEVPFDTLREQDITESVAPSVDLEQALYNVVGHAITRVDGELSAKRPKSRWLVGSAIRSVLSQRRLDRLDKRLNRTDRNAAAFCQNNRYIIALLQLGG